jgi:DHA1 family bicyclomycin/chloramphenicol resistance-like MFS transporter
MAPMSTLAEAPDAKAAHAAASRARRAGMILLLGALTAFGALSIDMYLPGLPALARDLRSSEGAAATTVAAFVFGMAMGQLLYGPLADRFGRRPPLLAGIALYTAASLGCALAPSMGLLIGLRMVQGVGACAGIVIARAVVRDLYEPRESVNVFSLLMLVMGLAPILAPLVGGYVVVAIGWRAIFWILAGFGALAGLAVLAVLRETRPASVAAHAAAERTGRSYLALVRDRPIMGYCLAGSFSAAALFAYIASASSLLIETYHVPVQAFGWVFGLNAVGVIGSGQLNRRLTRRWSSRTILRGANVVAVIASLVMAGAALTGAGEPLSVLAPLWICLATYGVAAPNAIAEVMKASGPRAGAASGLFGFMQSLTGAGVATLTGVLHDGTARPMAVVMAGVLIASALALSLTRPSREG